MAKIKIKIVQEQHFIEGDRYNVFLNQQGRAQIIIACNVKPDAYLQMCEKLDGLRFRLTELGNDVSVETVLERDPNFETQEQANEYLMNKGC